MANQDPVAEVMAQDDQEPDVEAHSEVVGDPVAEVMAQDDQEPDVEAHGWGGTVEETVDAAADVSA